MNRSGGSPERYLNCLCPLARVLTFGFLKDVGKLRDDLKAKESMKNIEKRKQGKVTRAPPQLCISN